MQFETGQTVFPIRTTTREGTGTATYLGRYTEHVTEQINVLTMSSTGVATFTAANGRHLVRKRGPDTRPGYVPRRCSQSSRSTPSQAERDASLAQPAPSRWKPPWSRQRALSTRQRVRAEPSTTRCRKGHFKRCSGRRGQGAPLSLGRILHVHFLLRRTGLEGPPAAPDPSVLRAPVRRCYKLLRELRDLGRKGVRESNGHRLPTVGGSDGEKSASGEGATAV